MDGGQSCRRVDVREGLDEDPRAFETDYFMSEAAVNVFKNDIKARPYKKKTVVSQKY
jgi:hypothetical protein